eukprot:TRINITY_DN147_c0_g2_i2.p1 TRINITY_DN147_c0_g2~~TRINITY_DN147_c0_g2_i2.p1  ORF type:complete len:488 (+),score=63.18 TRINITY_DN147_c0_g2_i2:1150-2613(+)
MGIVHRDLKPENLLVGVDNTLKIADFGLSQRFVGPSNQPMQLSNACGTRKYCAPECFSELTFDAVPTDVWSCGVILFVMTQGEFPFMSPSVDCDRFLEAAQGRWVKFFGDLDVAIGTTLQDLLKRLLTVDPSTRITLDRVQRHPWAAHTRPPLQLAMERVGSGSRARAGSDVTNSSGRSRSGTDATSYSGQTRSRSGTHGSGTRSRGLSEVTSRSDLSPLSAMDEEESPFELQDSSDGLLGLSGEDFSQMLNCMPEPEPEIDLLGSCNSCERSDQSHGEKGSRPASVMAVVHAKRNVGREKLMPPVLRSSRPRKMSMYLNAGRFMGCHARTIMVKPTACPAWHHHHFPEPPKIVRTGSNNNGIAPDSPKPTLSNARQRVWVLPDVNPANANLRSMLMQALRTLGAHSVRSSAFGVRATVPCTPSDAAEAEDSTTARKLVKSSVPNEVDLNIRLVAVKGIPMLVSRRVQGCSVATREICEQLRDLLNA